MLLSLQKKKDNTKQADQIFAQDLGFRLCRASVFDKPTGTFEIFDEEKVEVEGQKTNTKLLIYFRHAGSQPAVTMQQQAHHPFVSSLIWQTLIQSNRVSASITFE